jgi:hypothetical protein
VDASFVGDDGHSVLLSEAVQNVLGGLNYVLKLLLPLHGPRNIQHNGQSQGLTIRAISPDHFQFCYSVERLARRGRHHASVLREGKPNQVRNDSLLLDDLPRGGQAYVGKKTQNQESQDPHFRYSFRIQLESQKAPGVPNLNKGSKAREGLSRMNQRSGHLDLDLLKLLAG